MRANAEDVDGGVNRLWLPGAEVQLFEIDFRANEDFPVELLSGGAENLLEQR